MTHAQDTPPAEAPAENTALDPKSPNELKTYSLTRYDEQVRKSPFAFEIFAVEKPPEISPFVDFELSGYTIDHSKGVTFATVKDKKTNEVTVINSREPHRKLGIQVTALTKGAKLTEAVIAVRKGTTEGEIRADEKSINMKASVAGGVAPAQRNIGIRAGMGGRGSMGPGGPGGIAGQGGQPGINPGINQPPGLPQPMAVDPNNNPAGNMPQNAIPQNGVPTPGIPQPNFNGNVPGAVNNGNDPLNPQGAPPVTPAPSGRRRVILPPPVTPGQ
jgi:hypothetical protein